jgi:uncharacterized protein (TIGR02118 family)
MSRVKLFALIPRRPDLTSEEFHDHYRHPHGTYGRDLIALRGYVQSHQIYTELLGPNQSRFEAVAELWFDNERDLATLHKEPTLVKYMKEDEAKFVDMPNLKIFAGEEEVLRSGPEPGDGVTDADMMWSLDNRPLSVKLLHFIAPDVTTTGALLKMNNWVRLYARFGMCAATPFVCLTILFVRIIETSSVFSASMNFGGQRLPIFAQVLLRRRMHSPLFQQRRAKR